MSCKIVAEISIETILNGLTVSQHMLPNGRELFVGTEETDLYPELQFKEL